MKDLIIFGQGQLAELADFYFREEAGRRVAAFTVDADYITGSTAYGRPVLPFEDIERHHPPDRYELFVAVSARKLNKVRRGKVDAGRAKGYAVAHYVSRRATLFGDFVAQENHFILEDNTIQPFARIGRNVTMWSGNHIGHHTQIAEDCFLTSHIVVSGAVRIGARCFIGVNATIRDNVTIGSDCVIGAGALVLSDLPDGTVVAPAATPSSPARHRDTIL